MKKSMQYMELKIDKCNNIIELVNNYFNVDCRKDCRDREIVLPRQIAMYFVKNHVNIGLENIGKLFPNKKGKPKKHATVLFAVKQINDLKEFDKEVMRYVSDLKERVLKVSYLGGEELDKYNLINEINCILKNNTFDYLKEMRDNLKKEQNNVKSIVY